MTPMDFVTSVRREVIANNLDIYKDILTNTEIDRVKDNDWRKVLHAFGTMNEEQRLALLLVLRLAMRDTVSNLFGILDGSSLLAQYRDEFALTYGARGDKLNGDLQDLFLAAEERQG